MKKYKNKKLFPFIGFKRLFIQEPITGEFLFCLRFFKHFSNTNEFHPAKFFFKSNHITYVTHERSDLIQE